MGEDLAKEGNVRGLVFLGEFLEDSLELEVIGLSESDSSPFESPGSLHPVLDFCGLGLVSGLVEVLGQDGGELGSL